MIARDIFVSEARRWIGTPYRHQASACGVGSDCLGLIRGIWRNLLGSEPQQIPAYSTDWSEPSRDEALLAAAMIWLIPKALTSNEIAEIVLFRMRDGSVAKHLGITAVRNGNPTVIHSYTNHGVVETSLSEPWMRKIVGRFDFPQGA